MRRLRSFGFLAAGLFLLPSIALADSQGASGSYFPSINLTNNTCSMTQANISFNTATNRICYGDGSISHSATAPDQTQTWSAAQTFTSAGTLDLSAVGATLGFKIPVSAGAAPTVDGAVAFDSTQHRPVFGSNGTTMTFTSLAGTETLTNKTISGGTVNLGASAVTTGLKLPSGPGANPTADGQLAYDTTSHLPVFGSSTGTATLVTTDAPQTLTSKTLNSPILNSAGNASAGTLGYSSTGTVLNVGDGAHQQQAQLGTWTSWTPSVTQVGAISSTITVAHYQILGRLFVATFRITMTAAGSAGNDISIAGWPSQFNPANATARTVGSFSYGINASGINRIGAVLIKDAGDIFFRIDNNNGNFGTAPSLATANNDVMSATFEWEF